MKGFYSKNLLKILDELHLKDHQPIFNDIDLSETQFMAFMLNRHNKQSFIQKSSDFTGETGLVHKPKDFLCGIVFHQF